MFALTIKKIVTVAAGMVPAARLTAHVDGGLVPCPAQVCSLDKNGTSGERLQRRRSATAIASGGCGAFLSVSGEDGIRTRRYEVSPVTGLANRRFRPLSHLSRVPRMPAVSRASATALLQSIVCPSQGLFKTKVGSPPLGQSSPDAYTIRTRFEVPANACGGRRGKAFQSGGAHR